MTAGSFLGRLAARSAAPVGTSPGLPLRPDPWRGRDPIDMGARRDAAPSSDAPSTASVAAHAANRIAAPRDPTTGQRERRLITTVLPAPRPFTADAVDVDPVESALPIDGVRPAPGEATTTSTHPLSVAEIQPGAAVQARDATPLDAAASTRTSAIVELAPRRSAAPVLPPAQDGERPEEPALVEVSIGRIEVRTAPPPPARAAAPARPALTGFADYAHLRAGIDRGRR
jgi:hypothetical protein